MPNHSIQDLLKKLDHYKVIIQTEVQLHGDANIKPENEGIGSVIDGIKQLLPFAEQKISKEEMQAASKIVENLRTHTRLMLANENRSKLNKSYYDTIFDVRIWLAIHWPVNAENEETGLFECPFGVQDDFAFGPDIIATSSGHLFHKKDLANYYGRNNAFVLENGVLQVRDPYQSTLTEREIAYMQANGVNIPRPDQNLLAMNRALGLGGQPVDGRVNGEEGVPDPDQGLARRRAWQFALSAATIRGAIAGLVFGASLGTFCTMVALLLCPPLPLLGLGAIFFTSTIAAIVEGNQGRSSLHMFLTSLAANTLLITAASFIAPPMIAGLAAYSIISSAAAASAMASISLGLSCIPLVSLTLGLIRDHYKPQGLKNFYNHISLLPTYISMAIFGMMGAVGGFVIGGISNLFRGPAPIARPWNQNPAEELLADNPLLIDADRPRPNNHNQAGMYRGLGIHANNIRAAGGGGARVDYQARDDEPAAAGGVGFGYQAPEEDIAAQIAEINAVYNASKAGQRRR